MEEYLITKVSGDSKKSLKWKVGQTDGHTLVTKIKVLGEEIGSWGKTLIFGIYGRSIS